MIYDDLRSANKMLGKNPNAPSPAHLGPGSLCRVPTHEPHNKLKVSDSHGVISGAPHTESVANRAGE